jgi:hypothetical protein
VPPHDRRLLQVVLLHLARGQAQCLAAGAYTRPLSRSNLSRFL